MATQYSIQNTATSNIKMKEIVLESVYDIRVDVVVGTYWSEVPLILDEMRSLIVEPISRSAVMEEKGRKKGGGVRETQERKGNVKKRKREERKGWKR